MLTLCSPTLAVEMLSPIAVTETAEVGTGWERGGDGVGRGGSLPLCSPMLAVSGPMSVLSGPYIAPMFAHLGRRLALCWPYDSPCWCHVGLNDPYVALC